MEGIARVAVAQEAMKHLEQNSATFKKIFANFNIPESEYQLLAGFDEDLIRLGSKHGYLVNQIHIVLHSEPQDVHHFLLCLSLAIKNFTAIVVTDQSTYRLPSAPEEFHEIIRASTQKSLSQHVGVGGSFSAGTSGGNEQDRPNDSTRKGKERDEDPSIPHDSSKEVGEPGPESSGPSSSNAQSAELVFQVSAELFQNGIPFQLLQTQGALTIKV